MGKSVPTTAAGKLVDLSKRLKSSPPLLNPMERTDPNTPHVASSSSAQTLGGFANDASRGSSNSGSGSSSSARLSLGEVVSDCVKRWFKDTLKEAKAGDVNMQVLVGQMYYSGYGVPRDAQKGRMWITRASRTRSTVWKVSDKHPGYNASDSDSDELKVDS